MHVGIHADRSVLENLFDNLVQRKGWGRGREGLRGETVGESGRVGRTGRDWGYEDTDTRRVKKDLLEKEVKRRTVLEGVSYGVGLA